MSARMRAIAVRLLPLTMMMLACGSGGSSPSDGGGAGGGGAGGAGSALMTWLDNGVRHTALFASAARTKRATGTFQATVMATGGGTKARATLFAC
jgi:hypothetical protein